MNSELEQSILQKDWRAIELAHRAGPRAAAEVEPYLGSGDPAIRVLAVDCLNAAGGAAFAPLMIRALADPNEHVRINVILALHEHLPKGQEAALVAAWDADHSHDGFVRQQIPMILGRMQSRDTIPEWRERLTTEPLADVKDGMIAGMAKMGDAAAWAEFGKLLESARGRRTAELIEYVKYLAEPWVIPLLAPVLERRNIAVDLSNHRTSVYRRECDLAVDEVLRISEARFSFARNEIVQYTDSQIGETLRYAQAQRK
jgi:HEAT repeat protein